MVRSAGMLRIFCIAPNTRSNTVAVELAAYCGYIGTTRIRRQFCSLNFCNAPAIDGLP